MRCIPLKFLNKKGADKLMPTPKNRNYGVTSIN